MLEQMRQKGASIFIYLIFGLLIVIFVINFAPQGNQGDSGCRGVSNVVVDVDGERASENSYKIAYSNPFNGGTGKIKIYHALDTLIRRELLASAASEHGIRTNTSAVEEEIKKGFFFVGGERRELGPWVFDDRNTWHPLKFKNFVQSLDVSKNAYMEEQSRGLQATLMAELLASSVVVSRDEALSDYLFDHKHGDVRPRLVRAGAVPRRDALDRGGRRALPRGARGPGEGAAQGEGARVPRPQAGAEAPPDLHREGRAGGQARGQEARGQEARRGEAGRQEGRRQEAG